VREEEKGIRTRGLDDPRLVGLGGIAVPLPVGQTLHHVAVVNAAGSRRRMVGREERRASAWRLLRV
jgi:hypothetical protein